MPVIFSVDEDLKDHVILVQDPLTLRQGAGGDIPQAGGVGVGIGGAQQQALVAFVVPGGEGIEVKPVGAPGLAGVRGGLLGVDPGAVYGVKVPIWLPSFSRLGKSTPR